METKLELEEIYRRLGKIGLLSAQVMQRFGSIAARNHNRLFDLSCRQLDAFGLALLKFETVAQMEEWLAQPEEFYLDKLYNK